MSRWQSKGLQDNARLKASKKDGKEKDRLTVAQSMVIQESRLDEELKMTKWETVRKVKTPAWSNLLLLISPPALGHTCHPHTYQPVLPRYTFLPYFQWVLLTCSLTCSLILASSLSRLCLFPSLSFPLFISIFYSQLCRLPLPREFSVSCTLPSFD